MALTIQSPKLFPGGFTAWKVLETRKQETRVLSEHLTYAEAAAALKERRDALKDAATR